MTSKNCANCTKEFKVYPSLDRVKYCSKRCYWIAKRGTTRPEAEKLKISQTMKRKGLRGPVRRGADSNFWRGGRSKLKSLRWQLHKTPEYQEWRKLILERDNYTCNFCGQRGGELNVDHHPFTYKSITDMFAEIKTVEDLFKIEFLFDTDNGWVLCGNCHRNKSKILEARNEQHQTA